MENYCLLVCLHVCSLPACQVYLVGMHLSKKKKVWCRISCDCWHNYVLQRGKQCLETYWEGGLEAAMKWYETVFHMEQWMSRIKPVDVGNSTWEKAIIAVKTTDTSIATHFPLFFIFLHLTAFDLRASGCGALPYFVCASDKLRKWDLGRHKRYSLLK